MIEPHLGREIIDNSSRDMNIDTHRDLMMWWDWNSSNFTLRNWLMFITIRFKYIAIQVLSPLWYCRVKSKLSLPNFFNYHVVETFVGLSPSPSIFPCLCHFSATWSLLICHLGCEQGAR